MHVILWGRTQLFLIPAFNVGLKGLAALCIISGDECINFFPVFNTQEQCSGSRLPYTRYNIQCHQSYLSCSILVVNHGIVSSMLHVDPTIIVVSCNFFCFEDYRVHSVAKTVTYQVISHPIVHDNISSQVVGKRRQSF